MIGAYFKLAVLNDELKAANKIRSKDRLDCISFTDMVAGNYKGLTKFVNHKGQLFFYKTQCRDFVNTDSKRLAEWSLTGNGLNFSSIYIDDLDCPEIGYGYPNANRLLSNGSPNPLFDFRNDGYLFLMNKDYSEIELLIIPECRNLISSYYQKLIDNGFDNEIRQLRQQAKLFYKYDDGIVL
jgi:hypothetical protein